MVGFLCGGGTTPQSLRDSSLKVNWRSQERLAWAITQGSLFYIMKARL